MLVEHCLCFMINQQSWLQVRDNAILKEQNVTLDPWTVTRR